MIGVWKANELQGTGMFQWELPYSNTPRNPKGAGSMAQTSIKPTHAGGNRCNHQMVAVGWTKALLFNTLTFTSISLCFSGAAKTNPVLEHHREGCHRGTRRDLGDSHLTLLTSTKCP